ncbi:MAG: hypothetical protein JWN89_237 [Parcubacteria group bacterium]|nr:hypothetical protein [Parcubacteria group bacterium]
MPFPSATRMVDCLVLRSFPLCRASEATLAADLDHVGPILGNDCTTLAASSLPLLLGELMGNPHLVRSFAALGCDLSMPFRISADRRGKAPARLFLAKPRLCTGARGGFIVQWNFSSGRSSAHQHAILPEMMYCPGQTLRFPLLFCNLDGLVEFYRKELRDARRTHGHSVDHSGAGHRLSVVRDQNELRMLRQLLHHVSVTL